MARLCPHPYKLSRSFRVLLFALLIVLSAGGQGQAGKKSTAPSDADSPKDPKATKTFQTAIDWHQHGNDQEAIRTFLKAFKQDNGQCIVCLSRAYNLAVNTGQYRDAEEVAREWLPVAISDLERGSVHNAIGACLEQRGILEKKDAFFEESREEFQKALALNPSLTVAEYNLGVTLAYLHQDDDAKAAFTRFLERDVSKPSLHPRAQRFLERVDLARAKMAPPFSFTAIDGRRASIDSLAGKVVLIDFWATWCGPCREALPHMRDLARKFEGQPFVMISISLDNDEKKWRDFVAKNGMTWMQYHEVWSSSNVAKNFNVNAIPATFSIDADGVLEDQHVGDANIDGKLKKMILRAVEIANHNQAVTTAMPANGSSE